MNRKRRHSKGKRTCKVPGDRGKYKRTELGVWGTETGGWVEPWFVKAQLDGFENLPHITVLCILTVYSPVVTICTASLTLSILRSAHTAVFMCFVNKNDCFHM